MPPRLRSAAAQKTYATALVPALNDPVAVPDLPLDALYAVFSFLADDVASLCAAACVKRSWHAAALHPALWRDLCFSEQYNMARRLTDTRLKQLVHRAGAALRCLDLSTAYGCGYNVVVELRVTLRGVMIALRDAPLLKQLCLRGVPYGTRDNGPPVKRYERLSALVCLDDGELDAAEYDGKLALCEAELDGGVICRRLCSKEDELCTECLFFYCQCCRKAAENRRDPPCEHLCDTCFAQKDVEDGNPFFACQNDDCAAGAVNGHCDDCCVMCDASHKILCDSCAYDDHGLMMCRSGICPHNSHELFCEDCVDVAASHHDEERKLIYCAGCQDMVCPVCMGQKPESYCKSCDDEFCESCQEEYMTKVKGVCLCVTCAKEKKQKGR